MPPGQAAASTIQVSKWPLVAHVAVAACHVNKPICIMRDEGKQQTERHGLDRHQLAN